MGNVLIKDKIFSTNSAGPNQKILRKKLTWESKSSDEGYLQPSVSLVSCGGEDYDSLYLVSRTEFFIYNNN